MLLISNEELLEKYKIHKTCENKRAKSFMVKKRKKKRKKKYRRNVGGNYKQEYIKYIKSKEWKQKRIEFYDFLIKSGIEIECDICGSKKCLDVHHMTYNNFKNEDLYDLQLLCRKCHQLKHCLKC